MKKLKLAILFAMSAAGAMAQNFEGSSVEDRIAHSTGNNEDSIKTAKGYITMFQQAGAFASSMVGKQTAYCIYLL